MKQRKYTITLNEPDPKYGQVFIKSTDAIPRELIQDMFADCMYSHEEVHAIYLDNKLQMRFTECIGVGNSHASIVDFSKIVTTMATQKCRRVIVAHNHPSGVSMPSQSDLAFTKKLKEAMQLLDFELVDSLIIYDDFEIYSLQNKGLM